MDHNPITLSATANSVNTHNLDFTENDSEFYGDDMQ